MGTTKRQRKLTKTDEKYIKWKEERDEQRNPNKIPPNRQGQADEEDGQRTQ